MNTVGSCHYLQPGRYAMIALVRPACD